MSVRTKAMSYVRSGIERRALLSWAAASGLAARAGSIFAQPSLLARGAAGVEQVATWIIATPRDRVLARAMREVRAGLPPADLLGGTLVAAAREIRPNVASFNHAALVVAALEQLTAGLALEQQLPLILWGIDNFEDSQEQDRAADWKLAAPPAKLPVAAEARAELIAALDRWDPEAADAALVAMVSSAPLESVCEIVTGYGMRSRGNSGHKAIYAMVAVRCLPLVSEPLALDVLRSCVASFLPEGEKTSVEPFDRSRELVARGLKRRSDGTASDAGVEREVLALLREGKSAEVPQALAEVMAGKASVPTLWDAFVMMASEVALESPGIGPLHALTATNALHCMARRARDPRIADLALLQAGAWLCEFRATARGSKTEKDCVHIESLAPGTFEASAPTAAERIAQLLGDPAEFRGLAAGRVLGASRSQTGAKALAQDMLGVVRASGDSVHEFKLAAAVLEEANGSSTRAASSALAALAVNMPDPRRVTRENRLRVEDAIAVSR
ncbi:MAG TPA: hypothetical protein VK843_07530 [Planctomycetota bacterium]|nr:hypothetical protein [Planctomycetota bacterium]